MAALTSMDLSEIGDIAGSLRPFLEDLWRVFKAERERPIDPFETDSAGMCGFTSVFLARALETVAGGTWTVTGGRPLSGGGLTCRSGRQNGHFWTVSDDGVVVDLTADQFGLPSVIVTTVRDMRYLPTLTQSEIAAHLPRIEGVALQWLEEAEEKGILPRRFGMAA